MNEGDSFTFDHVAWKSFSKIAGENDLNFPKDKEVSEDYLITIVPNTEDSPV